MCESFSISEDDFKSLCTKYGGNEVSKIFQNHIYGTSDYIPSLKKSIEIVGLKLVGKKNPDLLCRYFGIVSQISNNKLIIKKVEFAREVLDLALDGKISKMNKKLDWRHLVTESMKPKNQQNQEKTFVN